MAYSSILGGDAAAQEPSGRETELLGPSDNSDSGSDTIGTIEQNDDSTDSTGTGTRGAVAGADAAIGSDIMPDRVVNLDGEEAPDAALDAIGMTDLDTDDVDAAIDGEASDEDL